MKSSVILLACVCALLPAATSAQPGKTVDTPVRIDASRIHFVVSSDAGGVNRVIDTTESVTVSSLTPSTRTALRSFISGLPRFADYKYSSCHDRAHAVYMLLPDSLKRYAAKIWVFAPERITLAVTGTIGLRGQTNGTGATPVGWGYHVALAFREGDDAVIYDAALAPDRLITQEDWFGMMEIPLGSLATILAGQNYLFFASSAGNFAPNRNVYNGSMFRYEGDSRNNNWIPKSLARDAVGEAILKQNACPALLPQIHNADALQDLLIRRALPSECSALDGLFQSQTTRWIGILAGRM